LGGAPYNARAVPALYVAAMPRIAPLAGALALSGCASFSALQSAATLPEGERSMTLSLSGAGVPDGARSTAAAGFDYLYRQGVSDGFEYGFHVFPLGLGLDLKQELWREGGLAVSWSPSAGAYAIARLRGQDGSVRFDPVGALFAGATLYATAPLGRHELTLAPRAVAQLQEAARLEDASGSRALLVGATLGGTVRVDSGLQLKPELTALWVAAASGSFAPFSRGAPVEYSQGALLLQAALGVQFGR
jgi:hypothetical protein